MRYPIVALYVSVGFGFICTNACTDSTAKRKHVSAQVAQLVSNVQNNTGRGESLDRLILLAQSEDEFGAMQATVGLGRIGDNATPAALEVLGNNLRRGGYIAQEAAKSLGRLGSRARSQLPQLERALDDPDCTCRFAIYLAISDMGADSLYLLPKLRENVGATRGRLEADCLKECIKKLEALGATL